MSKNEFVDKAQITIADPKTKFFNFASEPLGSCLQPLSFFSFLLQLIRFVIELCLSAANVDIISDSTKFFLGNRIKKIGEANIAVGSPQKYKLQ